MMAQEVLQRWKCTCQLTGSGTGGTTIISHFYISTHSHVRAAGHTKKKKKNLLLNSELTIQINLDDQQQSSTMRSRLWDGL